MDLIEWNSSEDLHIVDAATLKVRHMDLKVHVPAELEEMGKGVDQFVLEAFNVDLDEVSRLPKRLIEAQDTKVVIDEVDENTARISLANDSVMFADAERYVNDVCDVVDQEKQA